MNRMLSVIAGVARIGTLVAVVLLIGTVLLQVVSRTFLPQSPVWTEELSRIALMYVVAFGVGLSIRSGDLVNVDLLLAALPKEVRRVLEAFAFLLTAAMGALIVLPAIEFTEIGAIQTSSALEWRMDLVFVTMPIAAFMLAIFGLEKAVLIARGKSSQATGTGGL